MSETAERPKLKVAGGIFGAAMKQAGGANPPSKPKVTQVARPAPTPREASPPRAAPPVREAAPQRGGAPKIDGGFANGLRAFLAPEQEARNAAPERERPRVAVPAGISRSIGIDNDRSQHRVALRPPSDGPSAPRGRLDLSSSGASRLMGAAMGGARDTPSSRPSIPPRPAVRVETGVAARLGLPGGLSARPPPERLERPEPRMAPSRALDLTGPTDRFRFAPPERPERPERSVASLPDRSFARVPDRVVDRGEPNAPEPPPRAQRPAKRRRERSESADSAPARKIVVDEDTNPSRKEIHKELRRRLPKANSDTLKDVCDDCVRLISDHTDDTDKLPSALQKAIKGALGKETGPFVDWVLDQVEGPESDSPSPVRAPERPAKPKPSPAPTPKPKPSSPTSPKGSAKVTKTITKTAKTPTATVTKTPKSGKDKGPQKIHKYAVRDKKKKLLEQQTKQLQTIMQRLQDPSLQKADKDKLLKLLATVKAQMNPKARAMEQVRDGIEDIRASLQDSDSD